MSFIDNAKRAFIGRDEEEYAHEYEDESYEEDVEEKKHNGFFSFLRKNKDEYDDYAEEEETAERRQNRRSSRDSSIRYNSSRYNSSEEDERKIEVVVMHPAGFDESARLVKTVKEGKITIFDVSEIESTEEARRVVDYISGAAEGMACPFSRLCPSIFCIAPEGVKLIDKKSRY